jgi:hypothetical protein
MVMVMRNRPGLHWVLDPAVPDPLRQRAAVSLRPAPRTCPFLPLGFACSTYRLVSN